MMNLHFTKIGCKTLIVLVSMMFHFQIVSAEVSLEIGSWYFIKNDIKGKQYDRATNHTSPDDKPVKGGQYLRVLDRIQPSKVRIYYGWIGMEFIVEDHYLTSENLDIPGRTQQLEKKYCIYLFKLKADNPDYVKTFVKLQTNWELCDTFLSSKEQNQDDNAVRDNKYSEECDALAEQLAVLAETTQLDIKIGNWIKAKNSIKTGWFAADADKGDVGKVIGLKSFSNDKKKNKISLKYQIQWIKRNETGAITKVKTAHVSTKKHWAKLTVLHEEAEKLEKVLQAYEETQNGKAASKSKTTDDGRRRRLVTRSRLQPLLNEIEEAQRNA